MLKQVVHIVTNVPQRVNPSLVRGLMVIAQSSQVLHGGFSLGRFSTLKMEVRSYSEALVYIRTTRLYITDDGNIHIILYQNIS
jgi:hypothetical protein